MRARRLVLVMMAVKSSCVQLQHEGHTLECAAQKPEREQPVRSGRSTRCQPLRCQQRQAITHPEFLAHAPEHRPVTHACAHRHGPQAVAAALRACSSTGLPRLCSRAVPTIARRIAAMRAARTWLAGINGSAPRSRLATVTPGRRASCRAAESASFFRASLVDSNGVATGVATGVAIGVTRTLVP